MGLYNLLGKKKSATRRTQPIKGGILSLGKSINQFIKTCC